MSFGFVFDWIYVLFGIDFKVGNIVYLRDLGWNLVGSNLSFSLSLEIVLYLELGLWLVWVCIKFVFSFVLSLILALVLGWILIWCFGIYLCLNLIFNLDWVWFCGFCILVYVMFWFWTWVMGYDWICELFLRLRLVSEVKVWSFGFFTDFRVWIWFEFLVWILGLVSGS